MDCAEENKKFVSFDIDMHSDPDSEYQPPLESHNEIKQEKPKKKKVKYSYMGSSRSWKLRCHRMDIGVAPPEERTPRKERPSKKYRPPTPESVRERFSPIHTPSPPPEERNDGITWEIDFTGQKEQSRTKENEKNVAETTTKKAKKVKFNYLGSNRENAGLKCHSIRKAANTTDQEATSPRVERPRVPRTRRSSIPPPAPKLKPKPKKKPGQKTVYYPDGTFKYVDVKPKPKKEKVDPPQPAPAEPTPAEEPAPAEETEVIDYPDINGEPIEEYDTHDDGELNQMDAEDFIQRDWELIRVSNDVNVLLNAFAHVLDETKEQAFAILNISPDSMNTEEDINRLEVEIRLFLSDCTWFDFKIRRQLNEINNEGRQIYATYHDTLEMRQRAMSRRIAYLRDQLKLRNKTYLESTDRKEGEVDHIKDDPMSTEHWSRYTRPKKKRVGKDTPQQRAESPVDYQTRLKEFKRMILQHDSVPERVCETARQDVSKDSQTQPPPSNEVLEPQRDSRLPPSKMPDEILVPSPPKSKRRHSSPRPPKYVQERLEYASHRDMIDVVPKKSLITENDLISDEILEEFGYHARKLTSERSVTVKGPVPPAHPDRLMDEAMSRPHAVPHPPSGFNGGVDRNGRRNGMPASIQRDMAQMFPHQPQIEMKYKYERHDRKSPLPPPIQRDMNRMFPDNGKQKLRPLGTAENLYENGFNIPKSVPSARKIKSDELKSNISRIPRYRPLQNKKDQRSNVQKSQDKSVDQSLEIADMHTKSKYKENPPMKRGKSVKGAINPSIYSEKDFWKPKDNTQANNSSDYKDKKEKRKAYDDALRSKAKKHTSNQTKKNTPRASAQIETSSPRQSMAVDKKKIKGIVKASIYAENDFWAPKSEPTAVPRRRIGNSDKTVKLPPIVRRRV